MQSPGLSKWSPGQPKRSPGLSKRSSKKLEALITLLFLSFKRREKNLGHNHIFRIRICKKRFKMDFTSNVKFCFLEHNIAEKKVVFFYQGGLFVESENV